MPDPTQVAKALLDRGAFLQAAELARSWLVDRPDDPAILINAGGILIDAGRHLGRAVVSEGVAATERALTLGPPPDRRLTATYNLANGLLALHEMDNRKYGVVEFEPQLEKISSLYYQVIDSGGRLTREAQLNFVSVLQRQGRSIEALRMAQAGLLLDRAFSRGWASLGDAAWGVYAFNAPESSLLSAAGLAYRKALSLETTDQPFRQYLQQTLAKLETLLLRRRSPHSEQVNPWRRLDGRRAGELTWKPANLEAFIWRNELGLNLCPGCRHANGSSYDRYPLPGFLAARTGGLNAYQLPIEINALVQGYIGARTFFWLSRAKSLPGLEVIRYPVRGTAFSRRALFLDASLREVYGLLDRVASLLNHHFELGLEPWRVSFPRLFFKERQGQMPAFRTNVTFPSFVGMRALMYLAANFLLAGGRFADLRNLRNDLQHAVVVPTQSSRDNVGPWRAMPIGDLEAKSFQLLHLCRAAIHYAVNALHGQQKRAVETLRELKVPVGRGKRDVIRDRARRAP